MGWEKRGNRLVYYRKKRVGHRVVSVYCGSGERGRAAELEDLERRRARGIEKEFSTTPPTPESGPHSQLGAGRESLQELFARAVKSRRDTSDVLQGATPAASEGATPQTVERATDAKSEPRRDWSKYLPQRRPPYRRYRS